MAWAGVLTDIDTSTGKLTVSWCDGSSSSVEYDEVFIYCFCAKRLFKCQSFQQLYRVDVDSFLHTLHDFYDDDYLHDDDDSDASENDTDDGEDDDEYGDSDEENTFEQTDLLQPRLS